MEYNGLSEQEILNKLHHISVVANNYLASQEIKQSKVIDLLVSGFMGMLKSWWENYLTGESRNQIKYAIQQDDEGNPIFDESIGMRIPDGINTLDLYNHETFPKNTK